MAQICPELFLIEIAVLCDEICGIKASPQKQRGLALGTVYEKHRERFQPVFVAGSLVIYIFSERCVLKIYN
jgi:hypothetical protein